MPIVNATNACPVYGNCRSIVSYFPASSEGMVAEVSEAVMFPFCMAVTWIVQLFALAVPTLTT